MDATTSLSATSGWVDPSESWESYSAEEETLYAEPLQEESAPSPDLDTVVNYYLKNPSERPSNSWRPLSPGVNSLINAYAIDTKNESTKTTVGKIILWIASIVLFPVSIPVILFTAGVLYAKDSRKEEFKAHKEDYNNFSSIEAKLRRELENSEVFSEEQKQQLKFAPADLAQQSPDNRGEVEARVERLEEMEAVNAMKLDFTSAAFQRDIVAHALRAGVYSDDEFEKLVFPEEMEDIHDVLTPLVKP